VLVIRRCQKACRLHNTRDSGQTSLSRRLRSDEISSVQGQDWFVATVEQSGSGATSSIAKSCVPSRRLPRQYVHDACIFIARKRVGQCNKPQSCTGFLYDSACVRDRVGDL